ncbi:hypothetical protein NXS19_013396 [Fusarium pseudograminearum]|nr:hypothetical protein NXS19_013396 [Fusarium pseudograminearum]
MLGRLLHLGSGGPSATPTQATTKTSRPVSSLESVQEDIFTRNLLFPDAHALYQHRNDQVFPLSTTPTTPATSTANAFDYSGDVDLDVRDVRVIIMQDALGPSNASLLFDSHPAPPLSPTERAPPSPELRRSSVSQQRKSSLGGISRPLVIQPEGSQPSPRQGAFDRRASLQGRRDSQVESDGQKASREYREELATFSGCIFGNSELSSYKGTSTKVHVVPSESRPADPSNSIVGDGRSSIGRSSARSSRLSQSFSSQAFSPTNTTAPTHTAPHRPTEKKKVLITRLFPVNLHIDDPESSVSPSNNWSDESAGFPFPTTSDESVPKKKKPQVKQRRTPMYAVVLVVHCLPQTPLQTACLPPNPNLHNVNQVPTMTKRTSSHRPSVQLDLQDGLWLDLEMETG